MYKITCLDGEALNPGDLSWEFVKKFGEFTLYPNSRPNQVIERIGDSDIIFLNKIQIPEEVLIACPSLKLICVLATGYNVVDVAAARRHGVTVCNIPAYSTPSVVQMTMALILEICMRVGEHNEACHNGQWESCPNFCFWKHPLMEVAGKTLGIVGYGTIGRAVGKVAETMGMHLLVNARHFRPELETENCHYVPLEELYARSDIISLHCPQTAENAEMIDRAAIVQMKDGAILINTARGGLLNEQDVADALASGKLRAAGLDVVTEEPIRSDNPLLHAPNCILTPHIAWAPVESRLRLLDVLEQNLQAFTDGHPINVVS